EGRLPELANGLLNLAHQHSDRPSDELTALIAAALFEIANGARDDELRSGRTLFAAAAIAIFEALQKRDPEVQ
ncbi:MAG TPA: hypothetical protein VFO89_06360, partial [Thermoanaerobaculia bacterium]|nr:hypothetical protein [Thermoanaerobaculia bacterium]